MNNTDKEQKVRQILNSQNSKTNVSEDYNFSENGMIDRLKVLLKKNGRIYYKILRILGPVFYHPQNKRMINNLLARFNHNSVIVNVGSGPAYFEERQDIINVDIYPYTAVDILSDGHSIPIIDNSVDLAISIAMLEHTATPQDSLREIYRIVRPGGYALVFVPFMQPFHAAPNDYYRWTEKGLEHLMKPFLTERTWIGGGPTSGWLWITQEWLALLLSFGSKKLFQLVLLLLMILTFPLKWLDLLLFYHPCAHKVASGFYVVARK